MGSEQEMEIHAPEIGRARSNTPPPAVREVRGRVGPRLPQASPNRRRD